MSLNERVKEWLSKRDYDGEIPSSLSRICTPSTAFIWEQLISKVKPRHEVQHKKKCIIVNRLTNKSLEEQGDFSYPVKQIEVYMEKQRLEKQVMRLEKRIEETEETVDGLLKKNKEIYVAIDNMEAQIKETDERRYMLNKKSIIFKTDIQNAQETLTLARNLTPVETEISANAEEITKTLQQCAEKLEKLSERISLNKQNRKPSLNATGNVKPSYSSKMNTLSQYLNQSTILADIAPSTCKKTISRNRLHSTPHVPISSKCLKFSDTDDKEYIPKRQSLGLLPEDCFDLSDEIESFFLDTTKTDSDLEPLSTSMLEPPTKTNFEIIEKLHGSKTVNDILTDILYKNNRSLILNQCKNKLEELLNEIRTPILENDKLIKLDKKISQEDLIGLNAIHIKTELQKEKCRVKLRKLRDVVKRKKEEILLQLFNRNRNNNDTRKLFEIQIQDAYLEGGNRFLENEIDRSKKIENDNELQMQTLKIKKVKEDVVYESDCIQILLSSIVQVLKDINNNRQKTNLCVRKLRPFIRDFDWAQLMCKDINGQEIEVFKDFPLEYNRKFNDKFHREISSATIPAYVKPDSNDIQMVTRLLNIPFATAEDVIFEAVRMKVMLNTVPVIGTPLEDVHQRTYSLQELQKKEEYIRPLVDELESVVDSGSVQKVLTAPGKMKEAIDMWMEMPYRHFISERRQVDGHGYKYYEKKLEELMDQ